MAYVTGSAADMDAVKTALVNACTSNGWTEQTDAGGKTVLSNSGCYVRVVSTTDSEGNPALALLGRTSLDAGDAPYIVEMHTFEDTAIQFPVTYHAFVFADEVFFIINYSDKYQFCAFGQSDQSGLPGTGNWVAASFNANTVRSNTGRLTASSGYSAAPVFFWQTHDGNDTNAMVHNSLDALDWLLHLDGGSSWGVAGIKAIAELIKAQPSQFSGESVLLPIRAYKTRPDSKVSQVLEVNNARYVRVDNYTNEQVITLGTDEWMIFPFYKRDETERNGGDNITHTGTFGWAIKKA